MRDKRGREEVRKRLREDLLTSLEEDCGLSPLEARRMAEELDALAKKHLGKYMDEEN